MLSTQQIFWSIAILPSVLLVILLVMTLFETEEDQKKSTEEHSVKSPWLDARSILIFISLFGWFSVIGFYLGLSLQQNLLYPAVLAFFLTFAPTLLRGLNRHPAFGTGTDLKGALFITGQVLKPIPPHSNGLGTVQFDHRQQHLEMDAITTGHKIEPGAPVRIVDVIDNRILVVEPLQDEIPPDGGMIRAKD